MFYPTYRPSVAHPAFHARTFWVGAAVLVALGVYVASYHRLLDPESLLMKKLMLHALIGALLMLAFGLYYRRLSGHGSESDRYFYGSAHFWLTFIGLLGLMSNEFLIPEATLGWDPATSIEPGYYFLHVVSQAVFVPVGGLLFLTGQGYFLFRLGMLAAMQGKPARYLPNGELVR